MLLLMAATGAMAQSTPITTVRSWDFTKGGIHSDWASAQAAATSVWGGPDSSFRYSNANNLSEEELTDGTNPLKGLAGIYFTAPAGSLLLGGKDSSSKCLQTSSDGVSILLVDCAAKDRITIRFCASVKSTTVTITSDQMKSSYVANSTDRSNEVSAFVKENGNVVLNVPSKVRIYEIKVEPYVAVTNFNLSAETVTVTENKTVTVTATGFSPSNAFDKTLEWTTADENVANVANGVITGVNPGTTTITVTSVDGPSKTIGVTVLPTYSVTLAEGTEDADKWTIEPNSDLEGGETVTVTYSGEKKVKSVKAVKKAAAPAYPLLSAATTDDIGKVVCAAGHLHDAKTAVPDGCTAVGILGKVTATGHGLILALKNATQQIWPTINDWTSETTYAGTTLKLLPDDAARSTNLTSYTKLGETTVSNWAVAQKSDYVAIFENLGSTTAGNTAGKTYDGNVNAYITTGVGGAAISSNYWSATPDGNYAWYFRNDYWTRGTLRRNWNVRPVLGF